MTPLGQTRGNTACSLSPNSDCALYWSTFGNAQVVIAGPAVRDMRTIIVVINEILTALLRFRNVGKMVDKFDLH